MAIMNLGFFRELPHGDPDGPSLIDNVSKGDSARRDSLADYLDSGALLAVSTQTALDVLSEEKVESGRIAISTDGVWVWPTDLSYYVRKYNIGLPGRFIARAAAFGWVSPEVSADQLAALEDEMVAEMSTTPPSPSR